MSRHLVTLSLSTLLFVAAPPSARADVPDAPSPDASASVSAAAPELAGGEYRVLNGHRFLTPVSSPSGFTSGSLSFVQGFGVYSFDFAGEDGAASAGRLFLYSQGFFGQIGMWNRVSLDLRAQGIAAVGGDLPTIVNVGGIADVSAQLMPKVRLVSVEDAGFLASIGVGGQYRRSIFLQPGKLIGKALGDVEAGSVITQSEAFELTPTLMLAEGVDAFGAQLSVGPRLALAGDGEGAMDLGVHLAFDFSRLTAWAPLALAAEYQLSASFDGGAVSTLGGGLYYSGKQDFTVGLATQVTLQDQATLIAGQLAIQYWF